MSFGGSDLYYFMIKHSKSLDDLITNELYIRENQDGQRMIQGDENGCRSEVVLLGQLNLYPYQIYYVGCVLQHQFVQTGTN